MTSRAFSLLEILVVLAVMGLLAGMLLPTLETVQERARRIVTAQELRQISLAYWTFAEAEGRPRIFQAESAHDWAATLARETGLDTAELYWIEEDPLLAGMVGQPPRFILSPGTRPDRPVDPRFLKMPLSLTLVSHLPPGVSKTHTPLFWTRGLRPDGRWNARTADNPGVFGEAGGFVGFLDGTVEFYQHLGVDGGVLRDYQNGQPTSDIRQALPPGARIHNP